MPAKLRFEPQDVPLGQDFSFRQNTEMNAVQANETFIVDASRNRSLGANGEVLGFAKKQFGYDEQVQQARQQAASTLEARHNDLAMQPEVLQWQQERKELENVGVFVGAAENALKEAKTRLDDLREASAPEKEIATAAEALAKQEKKLNFLKSVQANPALERLRLHQVAQNVPNVKAYVETKAQFEAATNLTSAFSAVAESSSHLYQNQPGMKAMAVGGDRQLLTRAVASHAVDKLIGLGVCAEEKFGVDAQGNVVGISVQCDGAGVKATFGRNGHGEPVTTFLKADYAAAKTQQGLHDLQALDYITGQCDRHAGNIFVEPTSGKVTGIDNDLAFPEVDREEMLQRGGTLLTCKAVMGLPSMMHTETAAKIANVSENQLRQALKAVRPPGGGEGLGEREIAGAVKRLADLQKAIAEQQIQVVPEFNASTYEAAVKEQQKEGLTTMAKLTSYVGTVEKARDECQMYVDMGLETHAMREPDTVGKAKINPQFAAYQQMTGKRQEMYRGVQAQVDALEDKLAAVRQEMAKMDHPGLKDMLASLKHGGVDGTRKHLLAQEAELTRQLRDCTTALRNLESPGELQQTQPAVPKVNQPATDTLAAEAARPGWVPAAPRPVDQDNLARGPDVPKPQKTRIQAKDKNLGLEGAAAPRRASVGDVLHREHAGAAAAAHGQAQTQPAPATAVAAAAAVPAPAPAAGQPKAAPGTLRAATQWQRATKPAGPGAARPGHGTHQ